MTMFADLSVSKIDEMPPGRNPVLTSVMSNTKRDELIERLEVICKNGQSSVLAMYDDRRIRELRCSNGRSF